MNEILLEYQNIMFRYFALQISHHERYIVALPRDTFSARGRPNKDGSQGSLKIKF